MDTVELKGETYERGKRKGWGGTYFTMKVPLDILETSNRDHWMFVFFICSITHSIKGYHEKETWWCRSNLVNLFPG